MAFYPDVQPGQRYQIPASFFNDVHRILNSVNGFSPGAGTSDNSEVSIQVYNSTPDKVLNAGTAVTVCSTGDFCEDSIPVICYDGSENVWGVLQNTLQPGEIGDCIISGVTFIDVTSGIGKYASPNTDGSFVLGDAESGAKVVFASAGRAMIVLGFGSSGRSEYDGFFKLIFSEAGVVKVVNGISPSSDICGTTDLPGAEDVPVAEFNCSDSGETQIYLHACHSNSVYSVKLSDKRIVENSFDACLLGVVKDGKITQMYYSYSTKAYRLDWYL